MLAWIVCSVLVVLLVLSVLNGIRWMARSDGASRRLAESRWGHRRLEEEQYEVVLAYCRSDFRSRKLLVLVEARQDEDRPGRWSVEAIAAPYGAPGPFWKFGATTFVREERQIVRVWLEAEPGGRHVSLVRDFGAALEPGYERGLRFIDLGRRRHDPFKAYPHEASSELIEAFFGDDRPTFGSCCFNDVHVSAPFGASERNA